MIVASRVIGANKVIQNLKKSGAFYREAIEKGVYLTAQNVRTDAVESIQKRSVGNTQVRYSQGGTPRTIIASKAGEAPNTDTGTLVQSIAVEQKGTKAFIGSNVEYAKHLELGTRYMLARPFLVPALHKNAKNLALNIKKVAALV